MSEIIHEGTDEVVCLYCGYEYRESQEFFSSVRFEDSCTPTCDRCEKEFTAQRIVDVSYYTEKLSK